MNDNRVRIAAVGDIHVRTDEKGKWENYFKAISNEADILLLCGDLTDTGKVKEAEILAHELKACKIPVVSVLGNHDCTNNEDDAIKEILQNEDVPVMDGDATVINGVGIAGIKGFGGGFDQAMLSLFGEKMMKNFVQETVDEVLKLDAALTKLDHEHGGIKKIVLMHYAPIKATIEGEPEQIYPFLGCSRLAEPLNRRNVVAAFHGHAHIGKLEGNTSKGVKIFNVSIPVLQQNGFNPPFFVIEI